MEQAEHDSYADELSEKTPTEPEPAVQHYVDDTVVAPEDQFPQHCREGGTIGDFFHSTGTNKRKGCCCCC